MCDRQVQLIPFYGDIQLSPYMGIFLKIDTLQPMEKGANIAFLVYARSSLLDIPPIPTSTHYGTSLQKKARN